MDSVLTNVSMPEVGPCLEYQFITHLNFFVRHIKSGVRFDVRKYLLTAWL